MLIKNKKKFDLRDRATVQRLLEDAYLGVHIDPTTIFNPLRTIPEEFAETPYLYIQWLMSRPEYFQFIVKEIMNIELHPFQCVILKEMWNRKLPFLIGSRGMSKTFLLSLYTMLRLLLLPGRKVVVCGAAFRQSKIVFDYMRTFYTNSPLLADIIDSFGSESKPSRDVDMCTFRIGESIATMLPIGCLSGNTLVTTDRGIRRLDSFTENDYPEYVYSNGKMRKTGFFFDNGEYQTYKVTTKMGYSYIGTPNHKMRIFRDDHVIWCRTDELVTGDKILIDKKPKWFRTISKFCDSDAYNIGRIKDSIIPDILLSSDKKSVSVCLSSLFDTHAIVQHKKYYNKIKYRISFETNNSGLIDQVQYLLLHFGIICSIKRIDSKHVLYISEDQFYLFRARIGFTILSKSKQLNRCIKNNPKQTNKGNDVFLDIITKIEDNGICHTYDLNIPSNNEYTANGFFSHNTGEKIRGQRAHDIITDEINSINQEVLEKVIFGFAAVSATPMVNVKDRAAMDVAKIIGYNLASKSDDYHKSNQIIMSGTCGYTFQHMYTYWRKWRSIIMSKGNPDRVNEIFRGEIPLGFDWRDYSIMRIPFELLPRGFMDEGIVAQAQSAIGSSQFNMEYKAVFAGDSAGFFKRTLIESCVAHHNNDISHKSEKSIVYHPVLKGQLDKKYIFGIDPASEQDKFAITILEQHPEHRRIVYVWTSNKKDFQTDRADGFITNTNDFYTYCIFKIRDLMRRFTCDRIIIDSQGGGHMIVEGLKSNELLKDGEVPLLPIIIPGKPAITDGEPGLHIIELASFSDSNWISNANHGLKKDLENKILLFPFSDVVSLGIAAIQDNANNRLVDTQEDNVYEIEELKNELSSIVQSATPTGKEKWDTPDTKLPGNKQKGRMRKDRYSSLLIANMCARTISNTPVYIINQESGGFAGQSNQTTGIKYTGSSWLANKLNDLYTD